MIEVAALHKAFKNVVAVDDVSFTAKDGCITGLLGENGAGKSTTLRSIATILKPDRGQINIDNMDVATNPTAARRRLGVLPHASGLYTRLTGRENIRYFGKLNGLSCGQLEQRIDDLSARLGIDAFIDRRAEGFSHGEKMKIALARMLIHNPHNVVLDEPTNGLDVLATRALREVIRELRDEGRCVLFSSHIMQEVASLCDEIVVIHAGRVVANGTPGALKKQTGESDLENAFVTLISRANVAS